MKKRKLKKKIEDKHIKSPEKTSNKTAQKPESNFAIPEHWKHQLEYDAKTWLSKRESEPEYHNPLDFIICLAPICIDKAVDIMVSTEQLKQQIASPTPTYEQSANMSIHERAKQKYRSDYDPDPKLLLCSDLYVLSAVHRRLQEVLEKILNWQNIWPAHRGSHCFDIKDISTLSAVDRFCEEIEIASLRWILRWIWSIIGRSKNCEPMAIVIESAIIEAGKLTSLQWEQKFHLDIFVECCYREFPGPGLAEIPDLVPDEFDPDNERERVILELLHEHHEFKVSMSKISDSPIEQEGSTENIDEESLLSPRQMAIKCNVPLGRLQKQLERHRPHDLDCFVEVENPKSTQPKYLYYFGKVKHIIDKLKTSSNSPAQKKSH